MKRYMVITPEFIRYSGDWYEPDEYGADVVEVEARNKRDAVILGVHLMLNDKWFPGKDYDYKYVHDKRASGECPYTGVRAVEYQEDPVGR